MNFPGGSVLKNPLAVRETYVRFLGQEEPLEKEMTAHSSILAWKSHGQRSLVSYSPWDCKRVKHDCSFPSKSKCLLISWLQSLSAVILEPRKIKSVTVSTFSPSICHEMIEQTHNVSFSIVEF